MYIKDGPSSIIPKILSIMKSLLHEKIRSFFKRQKNHRITYKVAEERVYHEVPPPDSSYSYSENITNAEDSFDTNSASTISLQSISLSTCVPVTHQLYLILTETAEKLQFDLRSIDLEAIVSNFTALRAIIMIFNQLEEKGFTF